jgi:DNA polymerase III epsilon subunit-like protein
MRVITALMLTVICIVARAGDLAPTESQKIDYLIDAIATLENAQFVRNGTAYDAKAAADHLRLKLKKAGSRVKSAEDFIRLCASASSMSGIPYRIRFSDGRVVTSEAFLRQKLAEFKAILARVPNNALKRGRGQ